MSTHTTFLRIVALFTVALIGAFTVSAQSITTFQGIRFERSAAPGSFITLLPPASNINPYSLILPPDKPADGDVLIVSGAGPYQLGWETGTLAVVEVLLANGGGLRRIAANTEFNIAGDVGDWANDFQGSRDDPSQSASGEYSLIGGGQNNTASGDWSSVIGGYENTASGQYATVGGGTSNVATGTGSAIVGGKNNINAGTYAIIGGGSDNTITVGGTYAFIGAGDLNTVSSFGGTIGGGESNNVSGVYGTIGGGDDNIASDTGAFVGGGQGNTASGNRSVVLAGTSNIASGSRSMVGAGTSNTASGLSSVVGAGANNVASGQYAAIIGGQSNTASGNHSFIGGGQSNTVSTATHSGIGGGQSNVVTGGWSFIGGGTTNAVNADYSVIPGGRNMTLAAGATGSFGFNSGATAMSVSAPNAFVLGNADLWIANNDNTPRELRFYEAHMGSGAFPIGNTDYVAFKAPVSTNSNRTNTYTLPDRVGLAGQTLRLATGVTTTTGTMEWAETMTATVGTVTVTADGQAITAAQTDRVTFLRLDGNDVPANRTVTLPNGVIDGMRLVVRCIAGVVGNGVQLADAGNLVLNGDANLQDSDTLVLMWDNTSTVWVEVMRSDN